MKKVLKGIVSVLYGLVMIEALIMISPFAFYWYSLYAPALQGLHHWRATAWMEAFFLPHSVVTTSPFLELLRWNVGTYCFSLGIPTFLLCAVQVYGGKIVGKGVNRSWIYSRTRHPQYLALSVAGFGLLTMWPRIIILILFLGMLFAYYVLARFEERQMEARYPAYAEYKKRTAMFIPGGKIYRLCFGWIPNRRLALAVSSVIVILLVVGGGLMVRRYTISHATMVVLPENRTVGIAVWPMPAEQMLQAVSTAFSDPQVRAALEKQPADTVFTAHLLPSNYGMVGMFADIGTDHRMFTRLSPGRFKYLLSFVFPFFMGREKNMIMGSPQDHYKIVFSGIDEPGREHLEIPNVPDLSARMTPVVVADVRGGAHPLVESVIIPPPRSFWGDVTMPMF